VIDLRLMRQFVTVATELHFHRAAEKLNMAQPPLSQAIKRLEDTLGVRLLVRSKRQIKLTPAGRIFLNEARRTLEQAQRTTEMTVLADKGLIGQIRVGFVGSATFSFLPRVLRKFREDFPNVELDLYELTTFAQFGELSSDRLDIGFVRPPIPNVIALTIERMFTEPFVAVLPHKHPLLSRRTIRLEDLANEQLITFPPLQVPSIFTQITLACNELGFAPRLGQSASQIHTMMSLVAGGLGVSIVPKSAETVRHEGVEIRKFHDAPRQLAIDLSIAWRSDAKNPALDAFVLACRSVRDGMFPGANAEV
jgi:DNA-binding transcriptional LysR family regulator